MLAGVGLATVLPADKIGAEDVSIVVTDGTGESLSATRHAGGNLQPAPKLPRARRR